ncbi:MAG: hypothetical protein HQL64_05040 [Magnetococcales bacterium]|nr:hypothetical protein [Magnetococcales bacterium]
MNQSLLTVTFDPEGGIPASTEKDVIYADARLCLTAQNMHPMPRLHHLGRRIAVLCGHPAIQGRIQDTPVIHHLLETHDPIEFARGLNGSFLLFLYDPRIPELHILTDRFASRAFYYRIEGKRLLGSSSFKDLFAKIANPGITPESFFEYLCFGRLFGEKSYEKDTRFLQSASVLTLGEGTLRRYWHPVFTKATASLERMAMDLAQQLRQSVALYQSDERQYGLMLSGGLQSRAILAATIGKIVCLTHGPQHTDDFKAAAALTQMASLPHHRVSLPIRHLIDAEHEGLSMPGGIDQGIAASNANPGQDILPFAQVVVLGTALDTLFCGSGLPKVPWRFLGTESSLFRLQAIEKDMAGQYMNFFRDRLCGADPWILVRPDQQRHLRLFLRNSIEERLTMGLRFGAEGHDLWEFMQLHDFARHDALQRAFSLYNHVDCRLPALENDLFDLCLAMPVAYKYNGQVLQEAIRYLQPKMLRIPNADNNLRADLPPRYAAALFWGRRMVDRLSGSPLRGRPTLEGGHIRSLASEWHGLDPAIQDSLQRLPTSEPLAGLGFFAMERVRILVDEHLSGQRNHAGLLRGLLAIDRFFHDPS